MATGGACVPLTPATESCLQRAARVQRTPDRSGHQATRGPGVAPLPQVLVNLAQEHGVLEVRLVVVRPRAYHRVKVLLQLPRVAVALLHAPREQAQTRTRLQLVCVVTRAAGEVDVLAPGGGGRGHQGVQAVAHRPDGLLVASGVPEQLGAQLKGARGAGALGLEHLRPRGVGVAGAAARRRPLQPRVRRHRRQRVHVRHRAHQRQQQTHSLHHLQPPLKHPRRLQPRQQL